MTAVATPERTEEFLRLIGDPRQFVAEQQQVRQSAHVLSSDHPRLINEYPGRWVALHDGHVIADADTIGHLLASVDSTDPESRTHILVRFIDRRQQTLIL
jgi:hypothetical protein